MHAIEHKPDRRKHLRREVSQPCKVFHDLTCRYFPAQTLDVSEGGARVVIDAARPIGAGETVRLAISEASAGLLAAESMVRAQVVRVLNTAMPRQEIALRFVEEIEGLQEAA